MEQEKFRMPIGALIACILITVLLLTCVAGIVLHISDKLNTNADKSGNNSILTTQLPESTFAAVTDNPIMPTEQGSVAPTAAPTLTPSNGGGTQATPNTPVTDVLANCMNTVVSIDISVSDGYQQVVAGSGSGVLISSNGYIVTCNHVVEGAAIIDVFLNDGTQYKAELVGNDPVTDIAVIKINEEGVTFPYATVGSSEELRVGETVYAIGNALGELSNTVTEGIISALGRDIEVNGQSMSVLQTSAAINEGNSGGGLFLYDGSLIGIVNAKSSGLTSSGATIDGLGFAVPTDLAKPIIDDIVEYGFVTGRPYLGVTTKNVSYGYGMFSYYTYPQVVSVLDGSPAAIAGIQENDVITQINGSPINSSTALRVAINKFKVGDKIKITVQRGNDVLNFDVTLLEKKVK
ncbi:MAG: trypsin-like peptidase domain-containing protein, partial [Clostridia bacterium]|nr:trypsin-like peptidase domain-containing protein [Clostridia bacterium]